MLKPVLLILAVLLSASVTSAQRSSPPSKTELAEITERGVQQNQGQVAHLFCEASGAEMVSRGR